jgi:hypothetical protein
MAASARRCGLPPGLLSRQMVAMCLFNLLLHAKPSEPHLARLLSRQSVPAATPTLTFARRLLVRRRPRCRT